MAPSATPPLLVLDLDGTLVDTGPDLIAALNVILDADGFKTVEMNQIGSLVGRGARVMILRALEQQNYEPSETHVDRLVEAFVDHYAKNIADHSRLFPGADQVLDDLLASGWMLAVCTNKKEHLAVLLLEALGLLSKMCAVCGGDTFAVSKPDPRHLTGTIMRAGADLERTIMVGDTETDILTAQAADVPVIAVDFGYSDDPVDVFRPTAVASSFNDVKSIAFDLSRAFK